MKAFVHVSCSRLSLGVALTFLAGALFAPAEARAGCGDHVLFRPAMDGPTHPSNAGTPRPVPSSPARKDAPCSGPHCSHAPIAPPPAPVAPVAPGGQEWACVLTPPALPAATSSPHALEERGEHPFSVPSRIYHPPR